MGNVPPSLSAVAAAIAAANTKKHDGVRIKAPHYLEQHDEHRSWTSNKTWHFETGWVYHVTAGQVLHQNLNLAEIHTTSNLMTMHLDITPLNVHIGQKLLAFDVHLEPSGLHKQINVHGGPVHHVLNQFEQTAQEVTLTSTSRVLDFFDKTVLNHPAHDPGTMTFKADGAMTLESKASIALSANLKGMLSFDNNGNAELAVTENIKLASRKTVVKAGNSEVTLETDEIKLESGAASVSLSNGNLTTTATQTRLNGRVTLGDPAASSIATKPVVTPVRRLDQGRVDLLRQQIAAALARLPGAPGR